MNVNDPVVGTRSVLNSIARVGLLKIKTDTFFYFVITAFIEVGFMIPTIQIGNPYGLAVELKYFRFLKVTEKSYTTHTIGLLEEYSSVGQTQAILSPSPFFI